MISLSLYLCMLDTKEERDKLELIYKKYKHMMTAIAFEIVGQYQAEEDVVHNAIMKLMRFLDRLDFDDPKSIILVRVITKSCAIDYLRHKFPKSCKQVLYEDIPVEIERSELPPIEAIVSDEGYTTLLKCIEEVSDTNREACELRFVLKMGVKEIAKVLDITPKSAEARIVRGRKEIIKKLKEVGYNVERCKK